MGQMVLHGMGLTAEGFTWKGLGQKLRGRVTLLTILDAIQQQFQLRALFDHKAKLAPNMSPGVAVQRHIGDIRELQTGLIKTGLNRQRGKSGPMFNPTKALLLHCRHQLAIHHQTGRSIGMKGIQSQYSAHEASSPGSIFHKRCIDRINSALKR